MSTCQVLRCENPIERIYELNNGTFLEYGVCEEHFDAITAGDPWMDAGDSAIYMGADMPDQVQSFGLEQAVGPAGFTLTLTVNTKDGPKERAFWITNDTARELRDVLQMFGPDTR